MNRRTLLRSLGVFGINSLMPSFAAAASASPFSATVDANTDTYKWAEMIVRAHNKCSAAMLERHLPISSVQAANLHTTLFNNGVIGAKNSFGIANATNPLWEGAFVKPAAAPNLIDTERAKSLIEAKTKPDPIDQNPSNEPDRQPHTEVIAEQQPVREQQLGDTDIAKS